MEAHVEHAVGLVEHDHLDVGEVDVALLHQVEQPPGRRDEDVDAARAAPGAAGPRRRRRRRRVGEAEAAPKVGEGVADLGRELARRREHQHADRSPPAACGGAAARRCRIGSAKAAVLPVPVCAQPSTSRPASTAGIASRWIGVGVVKPASRTARSRESFRFRLSKDMTLSWRISADSRRRARIVRRAQRSRRPRGARRAHARVVRWLGVLRLDRRPVGGGAREAQDPADPPRQRGDQAEKARADADIIGRNGEHLSRRLRGALAGPRATAGGGLPLRCTATPSGGSRLIAIFVDADACPVKDEVYAVASRYGVRVAVVANAPLHVPSGAGAQLVLVGRDVDAADDWIAAQVRGGDVVVTADIPLAARCLAAGARVLGPDGRPFTEAMIGDALATRALASELRERGLTAGGPRPLADGDRSRFLTRLDALVQAGLREEA
jgi:uncharacterized protein